MVVKGSKQRWVGVLVLLALAVIFVPVIFNLQPAPPIDKTSAIPPAPAINSVVIAQPIEPEVESANINHDTIFSQGFNAGSNNDVINDESFVSAEVEPFVITESELELTSIDLAAVDDEAEKLLDSEAPQSDLPSKAEAEIDIPEKVATTKSDTMAVDAPIALSQPANEQPPSLAASGLPQAWVIQVASYKQAATAEKMAKKLKTAGYKAYVRSAQVRDISVYRVFIGPSILRKNAEQQKAEIDRSLQVNALIFPFKP